jgi:hypothetical protein
MRLALLPALLIAALCALLAGGCGGSGGTTSGAPTSPGVTGSAHEGPPGASVANCGSGGLRATGVPCAKAGTVRAGWEAAPGCHVAGGNSHASCRIEGYLCIAAAIQRGTAVSCALPEHSVFFIERG